MHVLDYCLIQFFFSSTCFEHVMFRTCYVYHQEDYIIHAALYGMLFMHLCKQSSRLKDVG